MLFFGLIIKEFLVDGVKSNSVADAFHFSDQIGKFFDGLNLLGEEVGLDKVAQVGVVGLRGRLVQAQQRLVHRLFQLERGLDRVHAVRAPLVVVRLGHVLKMK